MTGTAYDMADGSRRRAAFRGRLLARRHRLAGTDHSSKKKRRLLRGIALVLTALTVGLGAASCGGQSPSPTTTPTTMKPAPARAASGGE